MMVWAGDSIYLNIDNIAMIRIRQNAHDTWNVLAYPVSGQEHLLATFGLFREARDFVTQIAEGEGEKA